MDPGFQYIQGVPQAPQQGPLSGLQSQIGQQGMGPTQQQLLQSAYSQGPMVQGLQGTQGGYGPGIQGITGQVSGLSNLPDWAQKYTATYGAKGDTGFGSGDYADQQNTNIYRGMQAQYGQDFTPWAYTHGYDPTNFDFMKQRAHQGEATPGIHPAGPAGVTGYSDLDYLNAFSGEHDPFNIWAGQRIGDKNTNSLYNQGIGNGQNMLNGYGLGLFKEYLGNKWGYDVDPITGARL